MVKGGKRIKKKIIVKQEEVSDCGVCCLLSIIRYYNGNTSLEELRIQSLTTKDGVSAYNLIKCAKANGFDAKGIKIDELKKEYLPCIAHIKINKSLTHFVTIYKINNDKVTIMDPAKGIIIQDINEFYNNFTGTLIILTPKNKIPKKISEKSVQKKLKQIIYKNKKIITKLIILNFILLILNLISGFYIKSINYSEYIFYLSLIFIMINILSITTGYFIYKITIILKENISFNLLSDFFDYILKLPLKYIHLKDPGEIVKRTEEYSSVNDTLISMIISITINSILFIIFHLVIFFIERNIYYAIYFYLLLTLFVTILLNRKINNNINDIINSSQEYNNKLIDYVYGLTSIFHSKKEKYILASYQNSLQNKNNKLIEYNLLIKRNESIKSIIDITFKLAINFYVINLIVNQNFPITNLIIIDFFLEMIISAVNTIADSIPQINYIKKIIIKLNEFYNIPSDKGGIKNFINGDISITNVSFSYNNYNKIIDNLTCVIKENEKVLLQGSSGSGKSTICKIINKEYQDYNGVIKIGNTDLKDIDIESLRENVTYSSQNERIFIGTIKDNILMGCNIDEEQLQKVIKITYLDIVLKSKPFGIDTFLHGGGEELSGGERQRIVLARALIKDSKILILDETLSEVNEIIEDKIISNLSKFYKYKTIIYISHKNKKNYFKKIIDV